jgi:hypothetical protein
VEPLNRDDFVRSATITGGYWSAKDLVGHLTSWEEHALGALAAWRRGERRLPSSVPYAFRGSTA